VIRLIPTKPTKKLVGFFSSIIPVSITRFVIPLMTVVVITVDRSGDNGI